jgi:methylated-DNA-[protein]-cysteine S-methyltransferase
VRRIPQGKTISYRQIADLISAPKAFRAVGNALNRNPDLKNIPCHRVVRSDGSVGGYTKGQKEKIRILEKEGVLIKNKKVLF